MSEVMASMTVSIPTMIAITAVAVATVVSISVPVGINIIMIVAVTMSIGIISMWITPGQSYQHQDNNGESAMTNQLTFHFAVPDLHVDGTVI